MAWLIRKRASLLGRIEHKQEQRYVLLEDINHLRQQLQAIDQVIRQHETKVESEEVHARRTRRKSLVAYGGMGRFVLEELRLAAGVPLSTTELTIRFLRSLQAQVTMASLKDARQRMRWRLKDMVAEGSIEPRHQPDARGVYADGLWVLRVDAD